MLDEPLGELLPLALADASVAAPDDDEDWSETDPAALDPEPDTLPVLAVPEVAELVPLVAVGAVF